MKFVNTRSLFFCIACLATPPLIAADERQSGKFFDQVSTGKGEGAQFAQKGEDIKPQPEDNSPYHVRCWQNGILIVDEENWRNPQLQSRFVAMKPMIGNDPGLYLVDFYNTFCEIKKR